MTTGILGLIGRAETAIAPEGTIFVRNVLWRARSRATIAAGESVRVTGMNGLILEVDPDQSGHERPGEIADKSSTIEILKKEFRA